MRINPSDRNHQSPRSVTSSSHVSQGEHTDFIRERNFLISRLSETLQNYNEKIKKINDKVIKGCNILECVKKATTSDELSKLRKAFEELAQQTGSFFSDKQGTDLWKSWIEAEARSAHSNGYDSIDSDGDHTSRDSITSRASTSTRPSTTSPPPEKEVIELAKHYPVYMSTLLSKIDTYTWGKNFTSFKEAFDNFIKTSTHLKIDGPFVDPIQSRDDLIVYIAHIKTTYQEKKSNVNRLCNGEKINKLDKFIKILNDDLQRLTTFSQYNPEHRTPDSLELTSTEWIDYQIEQMSEQKIFQSNAVMRESIGSIQQDQFLGIDSLIDLNTLIEHPILTVLHRWTHSSRQHNSEEKKQRTDQLIQAIQGLEASTRESNTLKKAIKNVVLFHVNKITMARTPALTNIEAPYQKTRRKVNSSRLIDQMKKNQKHSEATSHTPYPYPEKQGIPEHEKQFSTALQDQHRIMQAIDPFFDQALWALTPTIESAKQIEISSEENPKKIGSYTQHFQRYNDIKSDIEEVQRKKLPHPVGFSGLQDKFYEIIEEEAQSVIKVSIEQLNEAIKKPGADGTECLFSSVSELQNTLSTLNLNYQDGTGEPHFDLIQIIQHLESFRRYGKIPEISDDGLRDYFEIYKDIQLKKGEKEEKEKKELTTMIDNVILQLDSIHTGIENLLSTDIPENQPYYCLWETKNPLHTAATALKIHVERAKNRLITDKVEMLSSTSIEALTEKKQAMADIGATLISQIDHPEITTPLQATCFESIIEKIKMVFSAIRAWFTGSSPEDAHSSRKTRLSEIHGEIKHTCSNSRNTLFSKSTSHDTQETGSPMHHGYRLLPSG
ncbi:MAG: hypothetical protein CL816_04130 [Coxiellaceae bacterium]|nr:hypothetical protein [Coxiellaceae bacterium]